MTDFNSKYTGQQVEDILDGSKVMEGATSSSPGKPGYVPAPPSSAKDLYLKGDGTFSKPTDTTYGLASNVTAGVVKIGTKIPSPNGTASAGGTTGGEAASADHVHAAQTSISGNAGTATKLSSAKTIALTGAVTGTISSDMGANVSIPTSLSGFDASKITSGTIDLARIPKSAIETILPVANKAARLALTISQVQNGDTVKELDTDMMYLVVNDKSLNTEAGYEVYKAGYAASAPWSGIVDKPLFGYPTSGKNYAIQMDASNKMFVNVPWTDTKYTLPTSSASILGGIKGGYTENGKNYKLQIDANGNGFVAVPWTDNNTTYAQATASTLGLVKIGYTTTGKNYPVMMDADGKAYVPVPWTDNNTTYAQATASTLGLVKIGYATNGKNYPVTLDAEGKAFVGVPWTDTNTTYAQATPTSLGLVKTGYAATGKNYPMALDTDGKAYVNVPWTDTAYSLPVATPSSLGGVKTGYTDTGKNYKVQVDAANNAFVSVPWTDTAYTLPVSSSTTFGGVKIGTAVAKANGTASAGSTTGGLAASVDHVHPVQTSVSGNAGTATKLSSAKTIALTGAVTGSVSSDMGANATINTTLQGFDASKISSGVISIDRLPPSALERMTKVANDTARFALTIATVQNGDTVKVTSTNKMYLVIDDTKLSSEAGYEPYSVGAASSVPFSGITGKPTTLSGYGITDGVNTSDSRLTNSRPASDVSLWAKASTKPAYNASEVGAVSNSGGTINGSIQVNGNILNKGGYLDFGIVGNDGGWERGIMWKKTDFSTTYGSVTMFGSASTPGYISIGFGAYNDGKRAFFYPDGGLTAYAISTSHLTVGSVKIQNSNEINCDVDLHIGYRSSNNIITNFGGGSLDARGAIYAKKGVVSASTNSSMGWDEWQDYRHPFTVSEMTVNKGAYYPVLTWSSVMPDGYVQWASIGSLRNDTFGDVVITVGNVDNNSTSAKYFFSYNGTFTSDRLLCKATLNVGGLITASDGLVLNGMSANSHSHIRLINSDSGRQWGIKAGYYMNNQTDFTIIDESSGLTPNLRLDTGGSMFIRGGIAAQDGYLASSYNGRTIRIGSENSNYCHYSTNAPAHWFNVRITVGGEISSTGAIRTPAGFFKESDIRLKTDIKDLDYTIEDIISIPTKSFTKDGKEQIGTIAQDVERICPSMIYESLKKREDVPAHDEWEVEIKEEDNEPVEYVKVKSVEYEMLGVLGIEGIKLLYEEIKSLKEQVRRQGERIDYLERKGGADG